MAETEFSPYLVAEWRVDDEGVADYRIVRKSKHGDCIWNRYAVEFRGEDELGGDCWTSLTEQAKDVKVWDFIDALDRGDVRLHRGAK